MTDKLRRLPKSALALTYLQVHLGEWFHLETLRKIAGIDDIARELRRYRQDGWPIEQDGNGNWCLTAKPMQERRGDGKGITATQRITVLERDDGRCRFCGVAAGEPMADGRPALMEIDHVLPREEGGPTEINNLRTLCQKCNHDRQTRMLSARHAISV